MALKAKRARTIWALTPLLILAFVLRVWEVETADLTFDEVATFFVAQRAFGAVIHYVMGAAREHPPVYYLFMNVWMRGAGTSEFALRYPSLLSGILAVVWSFRVGRRLAGFRSGWWSAALCTVLPFSLWAGRTARMYSLVLLFSLLLMESWLRWLARPNRRRWLAFVVLSLVAAMTHYYLALLWPVQALLFLLFPRATRPIRKAWLAAAGIGVMMTAFIAVSPGIRAMVLEITGRFPASLFRIAEWGVAFTDFYVWGYRPELIWTGWIGVGLTLVGWTLAARRQRVTGALLAAWGIIPLLIASLVPEKLETRYLTPLFPALIFGIAILLGRLQGRLWRLLTAGGILAFAVWRVPLLYENPDTTFSTRMRILNAAAWPGDALIMNGPWPALLLSYYTPPDFIRVYAVPSEAPPGFAAETDFPRLEQITHSHARVWVSYGAIHWADPQYSVSRWLAEHTYRVYDHAGLALYLPAGGKMIKVCSDIALGPHTALRHAMVDRQDGQVGDIVRIALGLEGQHLDPHIELTVGLLDAQGDIWQQRRVSLGPLYRPTRLTLPEQWNEQLGLWLLPGLPPGNYTLALQIRGENIASEKAVNVGGWIPLTPFHVVAGVSHAGLESLLTDYPAATPTFAQTLTAISTQPYSLKAMQGYSTGFYVWWQVNGKTSATQVRIRLVGPQYWEAGIFSLGPNFYPPDSWQPGDVIRQNITFHLPDDLPAGHYRVQVQAQTADGAIVLPSIVSSDNDWAELFTFTVEARKHNYVPPLWIRRRDVRFGNVLRLRGYRLERETVQAGGSVKLTVYWQALEKPPKIYAVFNHLRAPDNTGVWHGDSWPQAGLYTTEHWRKNEVVAETYTIVIPQDTAHGTYSLYTGVYDPATGERLPATAGDGERLLNDEFILLTLTVGP